MSLSRSLLPAATLVLLGLGCATPETVQRRSSLASYLGAKPAPPAAPAQGPALVELPFHLGIAFVPADPTQSRGELTPTNQLGPLGPGQESELHGKVAAYMVKGDKNDTTTVVDAAVYHVPSRTLLFRAGGVGTAKGTSTWSGREDAFRQAVATGTRTDFRLLDRSAPVPEVPTPR